MTYKSHTFLIILLLQHYKLVGVDIVIYQRQTRFFFFDLSVFSGLNRCNSALPIKIPAGEFSVTCYLQTSKAEFRIAEGTQH